MTPTLDTPSSCSVLLLDARSGTCRSVIRYLQGCASSAMTCGRPVAPAVVTRDGVTIEYSWCPGHKGLYLRVPEKAVRIPTYCR
jgi:hypothetical protein